MVKKDIWLRDLKQTKCPLCPSKCLSKDTIMPPPQYQNMTRKANGEFYCSVSPTLKQKQFSRPQPTLLVPTSYFMEKTGRKNATQCSHIE